MDSKPTDLKLLEPASPEALLPDHGLWPWLLAAALAAVLALGMMIWLRRRRQSTAVNPLARRKAAFAEAGAAIAHVTADDARDAAVQASLILRSYLSVAAADPALYETHEEFGARHEALQAVSAAARTAAVAGFNRLAGMKYAAEVPAAEPAAVLAEARALLETLHHGFAA